MVALLAPCAGERILDLGCGDGVLTAQLVALGCTVVGVDASAAQVAAARARGCDARVMDAEALPFPDGTVIARLAWSYDSSEENDRSFGRKQSFVAGHPKNGVQFMVKDSRKYGSTGGWLYAQFDDGRPVRDAAQLDACFRCHQAVNARDYVFTRYAR